MAKCRGTVDLETATIDDLQAAMAAGRVSTVDLALCSLQRILQTEEYLEYALLSNQPNQALTDTEQ